jgi:hypothetical protein
MIKGKRSTEQQVPGRGRPKALNPAKSRRKISDSQAEPEFQRNTKDSERTAEMSSVQGLKLTELHLAHKHDSGDVSHGLDSRGLRLSVHRGPPLATTWRSSSRDVRLPTRSGQQAEIELVDATLPPDEWNPTDCAVFK